MKTAGHCDLCPPNVTKYVGHRIVNLQLYYVFLTNRTSHVEKNKSVLGITLNMSYVYSITLSRNISHIIYIFII